MHEAGCRPQVTWPARRLHYLEQEDARLDMAIEIHPARKLAQLTFYSPSADEHGYQESAYLDTFDDESRPIEIGTQSNMVPTGNLGHPKYVIYHILHRDIFRVNGVQEQ